MPNEEEMNLPAEGMPAETPEPTAENTGPLTPGGEDTPKKPKDKPYDGYACFRKKPTINRAQIALAAACPGRRKGARHWM